MSAVAETASAPESSESVRSRTVSGSTPIRRRRSTNVASRNVARLDQQRLFARSLGGQTGDFVGRYEADLEALAHVLELRVGSRHRFLEHANRLSRGDRRPIGPDDLEPQVQPCRIEIGADRTGFGVGGALERVGLTADVDRPRKRQARHDVVGNVGIDQGEDTIHREPERSDVVGPRCIRRWRTRSAGRRPEPHARTLERQSAGRGISASRWLVSRPRETASATVNLTGAGDCARAMWSADTVITAVTIERCSGHDTGVSEGVDNLAMKTSSSEGLIARTPPISSPALPAV